MEVGELADGSLEVTRDSSPSSFKVHLLRGLRSNRPARSMKISSPERRGDRFSLESAALEAEFDGSEEDEGEERG